MISVERAHELLELHSLSSNIVTVHLTAANGWVLAEDIIAPLNIPAFPQSNMDGYAMMYDPQISSYLLKGEIAAGDQANHSLLPHQATRIFTGAALPAGADTVIMQEKTKGENGFLQIQDPPIKKGDHVRAVGAELKSGEVALKKGTLLKPAAMGFLASMGIENVLVYAMPKIGILVTGNELQPIGQPLQYGEIYESNSYTLSAALKALSIAEIKVLHAPDVLEKIQYQLTELLEEVDIVLMTGGVSVGDYDFTLAAMEACDVTPIFHKIKQKPGKPLLFGTKGAKAVWGLPGNPASVLTCFYEYVLPYIERVTGKNVSLKSLQAPLSHSFSKPQGLTHFLKAMYDGVAVTIQTGQESFKLSSFVQANCLAILPETNIEFNKGDLITIHLLPE